MTGPAAAALVATAALLSGRRVAEELMVDRCVLIVPGLQVMDPVSLQLVAGPGTVLHDGICQVSGVSGGGPQVGTRQVEGRLQYEQARTVKLPVDVVAVPVGSVLTVTQAATDPELVGRVFTVRAVEHKSFITARRVTVDEVTA